MQKTFDLYEGQGRKLSGRKLFLPDYKEQEGINDPQNYIASAGLRDAFNVALALGQPLLITGEPGTGKTRFAESAAWEFDLNYEEFHTKTTSVASDLFYHYDAIRRFQDAHDNEKKEIEHYITPQALGAAILLTNPTGHALKLVTKDSKHVIPVRSVVLIDEIDKAPRDFPNDILNEIEAMKFKIKETDRPAFAAKPDLRPIVILTSNSEKNLPDAFLRRCVFYHIDFPDTGSLKKIVMKRFGNTSTGFKDEFIKSAIAHFEAIRKLDMRKRPATAEFLAWLSILKSSGVDGALNKKDESRIMISYSVLAKSREDMKRLKTELPKLL
jgi:MoxR-like ATPase